jgi:hypothetical protein
MPAPFPTSPKISKLIREIEEDLATATKLYDRLAQAGFDPWIDKKKLLPGQN